MTHAATAQDAERRREPRLRSLLTATIMFDDRKCTMDCAVRNMSASGAKVVLPDAYRIPDQFELAIPHHDQVRRAHVAWRKGEAAGLALSEADRNPAEKQRMTPRQAELARRNAMAAALY
jgi:hypothetical protein